MALEQLSLATGSPVDAAATSASVTVAVEGSDEGSRAPRLPRWTRQEILVLIQGKRVAETQVRRGRTAGMAFGSGQMEPKWASVSKYCMKHGVNRGAVQCRKRWSNLSGDYKKIKEWESQVKEESESFWVMRNDLRRERKLPGFFDREVYDILDGAPAVSPSLPVLSLASPSAAVAAKEEGVESSAEAVFDSGRSAGKEDGLFSDNEDGDGSPEKEEVPVAIPAPVPISEKQYQPIPGPSQSPSGPRPSRDPGTSGEKEPASAPEPGSASQDGRKRKRVATDVDEDQSSLQSHLVDIMERNRKMLSAQLEAQNMNMQLEREQRRDHADSLVTVLNKLADALGRIADKL